MTIRREKGQRKPIRIVCGGTDLGAVVEDELMRAIVDGVRRFLRVNADKLGEEEADLAAATKVFAAAFHLDGSGG